MDLNFGVVAKVDFTSYNKKSRGGKNGKEKKAILQRIQS